MLKDIFKPKGEPCKIKEFNGCVNGCAFASDSDAALNVARSNIGNPPTRWSVTENQFSEGAKRWEKAGCPIAKEVAEEAIRQFSRIKT